MSHPLEAVWAACRRWDVDYEAVISRSNPGPGSVTERGRVAAENRSGAGAALTARPRGRRPTEEGST